jgi:hypothetical protein
MPFHSGTDISEAIREVQEALIKDLQAVVDVAKVDEIYLPPAPVEPKDSSSTPTTTSTNT